MLRIGEFSRLSQVTVKTLHHYDEIGLLKPSHVDSSTDYRYYTLDQLPRLHRIVALKTLGLSLEEIAPLLREDLPAEQIRGMLRLKQAEAQRRVQEEQARLAQIEFRLRQNEKYLFLERWAVENGYRLSGVWRFVWHRGPMHDANPSDYLTELQHPIEPA